VDIFAEYFDLPVDSKEHRILRDDCWIGGEYVSIRYFLGRLIRQNLFRESDDIVGTALARYLKRNGWTHGALMVGDPQVWSPAVKLLKHQLELKEGVKPTQNARLIAAIAAVMNDASISDANLAAYAKTTVRQIARMSDIRVLRKAWRLRSTTGK
jgi:hypothetical protein